MLSQEQQAEYNIDHSKTGSVANDRKLISRRDRRFKENHNFLQSSDGFEMPFPASVDTYPMHVKEIFK